MPSNAAEYAKNYYEKNREKIIERGKKRIICERCGLEICRNAKLVHQSRKVCQLKFRIKLLES